MAAGGLEAGERQASAARLRLLALAVVWIAWEALGRSGLVYPGLLPSWLTILARLGALLVDGGFWAAAGVTVVEIVLALAIGTAIGVAAGLALGTGGAVGRELHRWLHYLASTPKVVFLPLFLLLFGIGPASKVALGAFACSFPLALTVADGLRHMPPVLVGVGRSLRLTPWQMASKVYLPAMVRPILSGSRIALGIAVSACLVAEMRASTAGLGARIVDSYDHARFAEVYALLLVIVALAALGNAGLDHLASRLPGQSRGALPIVRTRRAGSQSAQ
jgi:ABC-type nitrate/sulfonate/bicarbonate transport system permease component